MDNLQDLDRMIGVKYKVAESLSRKLLVQSLNLRTLNPVSSVVYFEHAEKKTPHAMLFHLQVKYLYLN